MLFRFGIVKSPLCSFCKSSEETAVHLFSSCSLSKNIWTQTQAFFSSNFTISAQCHSWFMEEIQDQHNIHNY